MSPLSRCSCAGDYTAGATRGSLGRCEPGREGTAAAGGCAGDPCVRGREMCLPGQAPRPAPALSLFAPPRFSLGGAPGRTCAIGGGTCRARAAPCRTSARPARSPPRARPRKAGWQRLPARRRPTPQVSRAAPLPHGRRGPGRALRRGWAAERLPGAAGGGRCAGGGGSGAPAWPGGGCAAAARPPEETRRGWRPARLRGRGVWLSAGLPAGRPCPEL